MNASWLLGITVVFVLLVAACGIWMNAASETVDKTMDFAVRAACYDTGWQDGADGSRQLPPYDDAPCVQVYSDGYEDGSAGTYDPPED